MRVHVLVEHSMILLRVIIWLDLVLCVEIQYPKVCTIILFYPTITTFNFLGLHCFYYLKELVSAL